MFASLKKRTKFVLFILHLFNKFYTNIFPSHQEKQTRDFRAMLGAKITGSSLQSFSGCPPKSTSIPNINDKRAGINGVYLYSRRRPTSGQPPFGVGRLREGAF
jgi:hypothetical protein